MYQKENQKGVWFPAIVRTLTTATNGRIQYTLACIGNSEHVEVSASNMRTVSVAAPPPDCKRLLPSLRYKSWVERWDLADRLIAGKETLIHAHLDCDCLHKWDHRDAETVKTVETEETVTETEKTVKTEKIVKPKEGVVKETVKVK
eukprot:Platyproteum_vivax@DN10842_c0_g1_i1.p1